MNQCDYCQHVEMCGWRKSLDERGCDFFDGGNKWIPVHERSPEKNGNYLVTYESSDGTATLRYEAVDHYGPDWLHKTRHNKVVAWMPLPEPYKVESEETP